VHEPVTPRSLGLTGGIGSGKSSALEAFRSLGAAVLSSDEVVHGIYADPVVRDAVTKRFGVGVLAPNGSVDRAALAGVVFGDPDARRFLELLIHPRVGAARTEWERMQRALVPPPPLLVCEVPLLYEADLADQFDAVLVVTASDEVRRERVEARGQDFEARRDQQMSESDKVRRADRAFVNDGSLAQLEAWVRTRFDEYRV
jgi:dephospho-CoA kinase